MLNILLKAVLGTATKALMALGTKEVMEWALFFVLEKYVASTKTKSDDLLLAKFREAFNETENKVTPNV